MMAKDNEELLKSFMELGLSEQKAKETLKNANVTKSLCTILHEVIRVHISILFVLTNL